MADKIEAVARLKEQVARAGTDSYDVGALSDAIDEVFRALGTEDIADLVRDLVRRQEIGPADGSLVLRVAVWSGSENGTSLLSHLDEWLREADDPAAVAVALDQEVFPFVDAEEMRAVLTRVAVKFPEHADRCAQLISRRPESR